MNNCKNCNKIILDNFCSSCGQAGKITRIDAHYILHEIEHVLHFDKGILFTIKELLLRPGQIIREFITENRGRLVKPILFIILSSLIYTMISHYFNIEEGYIKFEETKKTVVSTIFDWIGNHYGYANIIMGIFIAFWSNLFYKKYDYNFFEILILLCFVEGIGMLLLSAFAFLEGVTKFHLMQVSGIIFFIYATWAIGQFFDEQKTTSYLKAFAAYVLGMLTFTFSAIILGYICDYFI
jgi:hypothetical protein